MSRFIDLQDDSIHEDCKDEPAAPSGVVLYRKKPVTVQAVHWDGAVVTATTIIDWMLANGGTARYHDDPSALSIDTLEGTMNAVPGDWIIKGVAGEFYPCRADIFAETYEPGDSDGVSTWTVTRLSLIGALRESLDGAALGLEGLGDLADAILAELGEPR